ncbi:MAG: hypothetical protein ABSE59_02735 [Opitutaceae bacterium]|jgi:hypothetical protein
MNPNSSLAKQNRRILWPAGFALGLSLLAGCIVEPRHRGYYGPPPPPPGEAVIVQVAPPAPMVETIPPQPSIYHVWCPGHWRYNGGYYWAPGHWEVPPRGYGRWIAPHWEPRGDGSFFFVEGRWR